MRLVWLAANLLYEFGSVSQRVKNFLLVYNFTLIQRFFLKRYRFLHLINSFTRDTGFNDVVVGKAMQAKSYRY